MSKAKQHSALSDEKWFKFPQQQQLLMIANELNRAANWIEKKDFKIVRSCFERALELTQPTIDDKRWQKKLGELTRFNEVLAEMYIYPDNSNVDIKMLIKSLISFDSHAFNLLYGKN